MTHSGTQAPPPQCERSELWPECAPDGPPARLLLPLQILASSGFLYDSTIPEAVPSATSPSAAQRLWPYTMDYGIPQVGGSRMLATLGQGSFAARFRACHPLQCKLHALCLAHVARTATPPTQKATASRKSDTQDSGRWAKAAATAATFAQLSPCLACLGMYCPLRLQVPMWYLSTNLGGTGGNASSGGSGAASSSASSAATSAPLLGPYVSDFVPAGAQPLLEFLTFNFEAAYGVSRGRGERAERGQRAAGG